jgi:hypothetical protein
LSSSTRRSPPPVPSTGSFFANGPGRGRSNPGVTVPTPGSRTLMVSS